MTLRSVAGLALVASMLAPPAVATAGPLAGGDEGEGSLRLDCAGTRIPGVGVGAGEVAFAVSATFGEGEILALVDPETKAVERTLYDAEATSGALRFKDGSEATIVWTRMSGVSGPLLGQAIASDGDVVALSIDRAPDSSAGRPFTLFRAAGADLYRGVCAVQRPD
jgi:hypothetical protein